MRILASTRDGSVLGTDWFSTPVVPLHLAGESLARNDPFAVFCASVSPNALSLSRKELSASVRTCQADCHSEADLHRPANGRKPVVFGHHLPVTSVVA